MWNMKGNESMPFFLMTTTANTNLSLYIFNIIARNKRFLYVFQNAAGAEPGFFKGGVTIRGSPTIHGLYSCDPSRIRGLSRIIAAWRPILTKDKSRWRKYFTKNQILKKWAFQQWLLWPRYCHGVFATWILWAVCSKEGLPRGVTGTPGLPPSYAPVPQNDFDM